MATHVAYLINQYPKVSHTFIRSEILAVERQGLTVSRFAIRGWTEATFDPIDASEKNRTHYVLKDGFIPLICAMIATIISRPARTFAAVLSAWKFSRRPGKGFLYQLAYLAEACVVLRWCRETGIGHIHAHFGTNAASVAYLVHDLGGPTFSFTVHGPEEFDKPFQLNLSTKIKAASFVIAITAFCRSQLYRFCEASDWEKIKIVHCGLDERFERVAETRSLSDRSLVCVGRLCEQKGQLVLLEALSILNQRSVRVTCTLAGDGEMRPLIESMIAKFDLQDQVQITGWVGPDRVLELLQNSRALVLPSFAEGLPIAIMEAMATRRSVISTSIAGIPELVRNGQDGLLVTASDTLALASAIEQILCTSDADLASRGAAAAERVRELHNSDTEGEKLASLFRQVMSANSLSAEPTEPSETRASGQA